MSTQDFNQEFPLKTRRSKRIVVNLSIALIATAVHAFLQTLLGRFVAGLYSRFASNHAGDAGPPDLRLPNHVDRWVQSHCISPSAPVTCHLPSRFCYDGSLITNALQQRIFVLGLHPSNHASQHFAIREVQQTSHWNTRDFTGGLQI